MNLQYRSLFPAPGSLAARCALRVMSGCQWRVACLAFSLGAVAGCSISSTGDGAPRSRPDVSGIPDAVVRAEPKSRYGNPPSYVVHGRRYRVLDSAHGYRVQGVASWYGTKFHGKRTSSGETYDMHKMTAAHKSLPLPTYVRVTSLENGRQVVVRVNDRGPFHDDRLIDLSYVAAVKLGLDRSGTARVEVEALDPSTLASPVVRSTPAGQAATAGSRKPATTGRGGAPVVDKGRTLGAARRAAAPAAAAPSPPLPEAVSVARPGVLYIQVGSFRFRDNAEQRRRELHQAGLDPGAVQVQAEQVNTDYYYRVLIGPLDGDAELDRRARELDHLGISGYLVVEQ